MSTAIESIIKLRDELRHFDIRASKAAPPPDFAQLLETAGHLRVVKSNARRQVYCFEADGRRFYLKRSTLVRPKDRFRLFLLPNRRRAEWRNLQRLAALGITVPAPIARGEAWHLKPPQYFILTSEVPGRSFGPGKHARWHQLGEFIALLHSKGVYHADLHPGNIRLTPAGDFALLDVQSVFFLGRLPQFLRVRNIGRFSCHYLSRSDFSIWLESLLDGYNASGSLRVGVGEVQGSARNQLERRYRSRTRRCLLDSGEFRRVDSQGMRGFRRRGFDWDRSRLETAIREGQPLKSDTVLAYQGVCIKQRQRRLFHRDRCRTSWIMSRAFEVRGIEVPRSLAYFVLGNTSYFLCEYLQGGQLLNHYLSDMPLKHQKHRALEALAQWVKKIHSSRLWQRDFKSSNIMSSGNRYYMLDLDSAKVQTLSVDRKIMNLAQLNASLSNRITLKDRLRFFNFCLDGRSWSRDRRISVYNRIWAIAKDKNTAHYDLDLDELRKECGA